jgi:outer membrane protein TolC
MKRLLLLCFITVNVFAQDVDYNKIILPANVHTDDFAERLVQLAWKNNPINDVYKRELKIAQYQVKKNTGQWLDAVSILGNVNEFVLNPSADVDGRAAFYPKYNIRGAVSLGMFVTIPIQTKQDRQRVGIAQSNLDAQKLELRNVVMRAYNDYVMREKMYKIQTRLLTDIEDAHKRLTQKYENGETTFEAYSISQGNYNRASMALLEAENNYKNAKLDLEKLIGVKLEDVQ